MAIFPIFVQKSAYMQQYDQSPDEENDELYEHHRIQVGKKQSMVRIDKFLMDRLANTSRNRLQKAIEDGFVKVNDQQIKTNYRIHPGRCNHDSSP